MNSLREWINLNLSEEDEKKFMKELFYICQLSGVIWYARGTWYYFSVALYFLLFLTHLSSLSFLMYTGIIWLENHEVSLAAQTFHVAFGIVMAFIIFLSAPYHRDLLNELVTIACNNFYDYGPSFESTKVKQLRKELKDFKNKLFVLVLSLYAVIGAEALVFGPIIDKLQGLETKETYMYGVYMQCPFQVWLPFKVDNYFLYILVILYELLVAFALLLGLCSGVFILNYFFHAINISFRILNESVANIEKRALFLYKEKHSLKNVDLRKIYEDENFIAEYEFCVKQNIEHHLVILRAQGLIDQIQKWPMFVVVFVVSLVMAAGLFIVVKGDRRIAPQLFSLLLLIQELIVIWTICYRGQELIYLSNEFFTSFYRTKWMHCPKKITSTIMIIQESAKNPLVYKAGGMQSVDYELYKSIVNTAYSYFNLVYAIKDSGK